LDIEMPRLPGLETLGYIMSECPTPVVMLSAYTESGGEMTMKALEYGAVDFVCKPSGPISLDLQKVARELVLKVRMAAQVDVARLTFLDVDTLGKVREGIHPSAPGRQVVVIASSTGGPRALYEIIPRLPADLPAAVLVVQHMSQGFTKSLAERLNRSSEMHVKEAVDGEPVQAGNVYFAPGNYHMVVSSKDGQEIVRLHQGPPRNSVRPSADETLESAAKVFGAQCLAVILTGMGHDGADGAKALKLVHGHVLVQNEATSVVFGMPKAVIEAGVADFVLPLETIADHIIHSVRSGRFPLTSK